MLDPLTGGRLDAGVERVGMFGVLDPLTGGTLVAGAEGVGVPDPLTGGRLDTGAEEVGMLDVPVSSMLTAMGVPDPVVEVDAPESTKMSF